MNKDEKLNRKEQLLQVSMALHASCQMQINLIDELKNTTLYKQKIKGLSNQLMPELEKTIEGLYDSDKMTIEAQQFFHQMEDMMESFVDVLKIRKIDDLLALMHEFRDGKIKIIPEGKHKKIFNQLDSI